MESVTPVRHPMVLVCGSLHLDVVVTAPHLPRLDETVAGQGVRYPFGGKGGNQALAAARLGARVAMAGRIGSDAFGRTLLDTLTEARIDTTLLQRDPGPSGMSVAIEDASGSYGAVIVSAANLNLDPDRIEIAPGTSHVLLQNEVPEDVNLAVAAKARAAGARVVLNAAPARPFTTRLLSLTDLLVVNRIEAEDLAGPVAPEDAARSLATRGPAAVIVTLGAGGLVLWADGMLHRAPAHPVDVVSTHGAGDAFLGALAAELSRGAALPAAARYGQAAAALHVSLPPDDRPFMDDVAVRALLQSP
jgi:ribokinase